jgi:hypothetical protein
MARAQGARAQMALAFETTYGTPPVGDFTKMPFASTSLGAEQPLLNSELLGYGRDPLAPIKDGLDHIHPTYGTPKMKSINPDLQAHMDDGTTTLAWCWRIIRADGVIFGFTDHDRTLSFDGTDFEPESGLTAPYLDTLRWVFIAVALIGIAVTIYARLDDWRRGQR